MSMSYWYSKIPIKSHLWPPCPTEISSALPMWTTLETLQASLQLAMCYFAFLVKCSYICAYWCNFIWTFLRKEPMLVPACFFLMVIMTMPDKIQWVLIYAITCSWTDLILRVTPINNIISNTEERKPRNKNWVNLPNSI